MFSCHFLLTMIAAMCGGPFLYGYNMGVVNTPAPLIREFYTKVYATRAGLYPFPPSNESVTPPSNFTGPLKFNQTDSNITLDAASIERRRLKALEPQLGIEMLWTLTIAICLIGGMLGAFGSGGLADKFGRKNALLITQTFSIVGVVLFAIVKVTFLPELMIVGRFLVGVASGIGLGLAPLYLSELATQSLRGPATSACHLAVTFGILFSQFFGLSALLGTDSCWPFLFAVVGIPSCITVLVLPFCPESPRYMLTARGASYEDVLRVFQWLYGPAAGEAEALTLCKELIRRGQSRVSLATLNANSPQKQIAIAPAPESPTSLNGKVEFDLNKSSDENEQESIPLADVKPAAEVAPTPTSPGKSSKASRAITVGRLLCTEEFRLPIFLALWLHVTQQWSGINAVMAYSGTIFIRIVPPNLVQYAVLSTGVASCASTAAMLPFMTRLGRRSVVLVSCAIMAGAHVLLVICGALGNTVQELNYLAIAFVIIYICGYAGTGCTPAILVSEMFLQNARAVAMSLAIATRWGSAFVLLLVFPYMSDLMGVYVFLVFAGVCLLSLIMFVLWLHETRGKPALQIHDQLAHGFEHVQFHLHMPHLHMPHFQNNNENGDHNGANAAV